MFATDFPPITIPSWVERVALPKYPIMPLAGHILLGMGVLLLLIGYFTPIKKLPSLLTALALLAYYPAAYVAHWMLFRFDASERALHESNKFEEFLFHHTRVLDWSILGVCAFIGLVFFLWTAWATVRKRRRLSAVKPTPAPPISQPQSMARPAPAVGKKVPKKSPAPPSAENPFNFG